MFEFDKFVYYNIIIPYLLNNHGKKVFVASEYQNVKYKRRKLKKQWDQSPKNKESKVTILKQLNAVEKVLYKMPSKNLVVLPKGIVYARYADDWVLCLTGSVDQAKVIKGKISFFLEKHLNLILDESKTNTTYINEGVEFLGYTFIMSSSSKPKITNIKSFSNGKYTLIKKRTTSRILYITPSKSRTLRNLRLKGFCDSSHFPPKDHGSLFMNMK
jgi:hypothetical protein